ncbi:MAG: anti-sigma factor family protein [Candidatus Acidiferrales bacterium]
MNWTCTEIEERLSEYLDGMLGAAEAREFAAHAETCGKCKPLVASVSHVVQRMRMLQEIEAPEGLTERIIAATSGPQKEKRGWRAGLRWMTPSWTPRYAMGAVTVLATCLVLLQAVGINPAKMKLADLAPGNLYRTMDRRAHLVYARSAKFVNDMRVVYEIQSRLRPEENPAPQPEEQNPPANPQQKTEDNGKHGHSALVRQALLAEVLTEFPSRSAR